MKWSLGHCHIDLGSKLLNKTCVAKNLYTYMYSSMPLAALWQILLAIRIKSEAVSRGLIDGGPLLWPTLETQNVNSIIPVSNGSFEKEDSLLHCSLSSSRCDTSWK